MEELNNRSPKFEWNKIENMRDEDISYFLYLEGKSIQSICKIRGLDSHTIQKHIIESKIRHRYLVNIRTSKDLIELFRNIPKEEKSKVLLGINGKLREELIRYINNEYGNMTITDKGTAMWIIGELKVEDSIGILLKGSVHKAVLVRRMAISAMGKINNEKCENALIRALSDENPQVVSYAISSLIKMKSLKAKDRILELGNCKKEYIVRLVERYKEEVFK